MKRLLKISILLQVLLTGTDSFAQWYGITGGYTLAKITLKNDAGDFSDRYSNKEGYHFGLLAQFPIKNPFSFETGFVFSSKGYLYNWKGTLQSEPVEIKSTSNRTYLNVPIMAKASMKIGDETRIFGMVGPYLGIGISGETKQVKSYTSSGQTSTSSYDLKWGSKKGVDNIRRVDLGINAGAGIDFNKIQLNFNYGMGLRNTSLLSDNKTVAHNRTLEFSLIYKIDYGSITSPDYRSRIKAVKRIRNQNRLMKITLGDKDLSVRAAAFNKLNDISLNEIYQTSKDRAVVIAAKIRLKTTRWRDEFESADASNSSLGDVIGAAALVKDPLPSSYDVVSACHKYIRQGDVYRIPELRDLLMRFGDLSLAEDYLNCGNEELHSAGTEWGTAHGYNIRKGNGSNRVRWGQDKN